MNEPITIERAQIGRAMYFPQIEWEFSEMSSSSISWQEDFPIQNQQPHSAECENNEEKVRNGVFFNRLLSSHLRIKLQKQDRHRQLNLQFHVRPDGGNSKGTIFAIGMRLLVRILIYYIYYQSKNAISVYYNFSSS